MSDLAVRSLLGLFAAAVLAAALVDLIRLRRRSLWNRAEAESALTAAAITHQRLITNPKTGLPNRLALEERYAHLRERCAWLAMLDLNGFKAVNDEHGHAAGDEVLVKVATRLAAMSDAWTFHLQGDEFVLLMTHPGTVERVRELAAAPVRLSSGAKVSVGAAVGVVDALTDLSGTLHAADVAMYAQKPAGARRV